MIDLKPSRLSPGRLTPGSSAAIALITVAGALLRVAAARGDLWLDEIWSFRLLETIKSPVDIVLALPNDNNHVLTTVWLALIGPGAPSLLVRLPAIILGSLCAPVAARIGARHGQAAAIAAAAIFAFDAGFLQYGSEARGYSGLILATLVAYDAMERMLDGVSVRQNQIVFGLAIAFGTFSHLTTLEATFVLCAAALLRSWQGAGWRLSGARNASPILIAAAAGTLPALACLGISLLSGPIHRGLPTPFSFDVLAEGLGRMARATIGFPDGPIDRSAAVILFAGMGAITIAALAALPPNRRWFPAIAILGLPLLHAAFRLPNQQYPRFHLTVTIALALLGAEVWALAWRSAVPARAVAGLAAMVFLVAQSGDVANLIALQRGHYGDAVAFMSQHGAATYAVSPPVQAGETGAVIRWFASARGTPPLTRIDLDTTCTGATNWLLMVYLPNQRVDTGDAVPAPGACAARFGEKTVFPAYGLSGFTWVLYRRLPANQANGGQSLPNSGPVAIELTKRSYD